MTSINSTSADRPEPGAAPVQGLQRLGRQVMGRLRAVAGRLGLARQHTGYTRFIIVGRSRAGSNFLRGLLNTHPHVVALGEIFQNPALLDWGRAGFPEGDAILAQRRDDPVGFVERWVFKPQPVQVQAIGFKIFYYHAQTPTWQSIWPYLEAQPALHVIHIRRANILRTHLSRRRAALTGHWVNTDGARQPAPQVTLDPAECLRDFELTRAWEAETARRFAHHPYLELCYEDLAADWPASMARVQHFLGVAPVTLQPETHKQAQEPLAQAIANYADLRTAFAATPWAAFFDEPGPEMGKSTR